MSDLTATRTETDHDGAPRRDVRAESGTGWVPPGRRRRGRALLGFLAVFALIAGAAGAWYWLRRPDATSGSAGTLAVTAKVERRTLTERTSVRGKASYASLGVVGSPRNGVVTAVAVKAGSTITAGDELFRVQGRPVVAAPGRYPYWRSLKAGDSGVDVKQLQAGLAGAGLKPGTVDGRFGAATKVALTKWQKAHRLPATGTLDPASVAVAQWPARVGDVSVSTGASIATGATAISLTRPTMAISLDLSPAQATRVRVGNPVSINLGTRTLSGRIDRIAAVATTGDKPVYPATVTVRTPVKVADGTTLSADIALARAKDALAVPVAAVVQDGKGSAAVRVRASDGIVRSVPVRTGIQSGAYVAVSGALNEGQDVVIGPM